MQQPDLRMLAQWIDPVLVAMLENRRRLNNEWRRHRKLATLETLWLMLAVSLDTNRLRLYEIRLAMMTRVSRMSPLSIRHGTYVQSVSLAQYSSTIGHSIFPLS